jgi:hypothetical protein
VLAEGDEDERLDPQTDPLVVDGGVDPGEHAVLAQLLDPAQRRGGGQPDPPGQGHHDDLPLSDETGGNRNPEVISATRRLPTVGGATPGGAS